jgi:hypothetical protein
MKALVLLCSLMSTPDPGMCDEHTAIAVVRVPEEFNSGVTCALNAMAYIGETSVKPTEQEYIRVVCIRSTNPNNGVG